VVVFSSMLYLIVALSLGLVISSVTRNQFLASQVALIASFMPAMMLSGFCSTCATCPRPCAVISHVLPATYFMDLIKTLFLAGDNWPLVWRNCAILLAYAVVLLLRARRHAQEPGLRRKAMTSSTFCCASPTSAARSCCDPEGPGERAILIAPALLQSLLFGYGATYDLTNVPYALLDQSRTGAATRTGRAPGQHRRVPSRGHAAHAGRHPRGDRHREGAARDPDRARLRAQLSAGQPAPIQLILDARNSNTAGSAAGYVARWSSATTPSCAARGRAARPLVIESRAWFNPNLETRWNLMPGMIAALSMLQTLLLTALSVAREREQGTFDQLLVTPMSPLQIMIGKALPPVLVGLVQSSLILLVALLLVRHSDGGLAGGAVHWAGLLHGRERGHRAVDLGRVGQHAAGHALHLRADHAADAAVGPDHAGAQHAAGAAGDHLANPLRFAIDLVQRVYLEGVGLGTVWHNLIPLLGHRGRHAAAGGLAVSQPSCLIREHFMPLTHPFHMQRGGRCRAGVHARRRLCRGARPQAGGTARRPTGRPGTAARPRCWARNAAPRRMTASIASGDWKAFNDPVLDRLQAMALAANPDLQTAALRFAQSRVQRATAAAERGPQVNASAGVTRQRQSESGAATRLIDALGSSVAFFFANRRIS
jgi:ABC-2 type transport system permease protein